MYASDSPVRDGLVAPLSRVGPKDFSVASGLAAVIPCPPESTREAALDAVTEGLDGFRIGLFGDLRRERAGALFFQQVVTTGSLVLRQVGGDRAGEVAAQRFLGSPRVTAEEIVARLGGWNCYYKKPGPKTMRNGWNRLAAMAEGFALANARKNA